VPLWPSALLILCCENVFVVLSSTIETTSFCFAMPDLDTLCFWALKEIQPWWWLDFQSRNFCEHFGRLNWWSIFAECW
jgi:hypothetical protein